MLHWIVVQKVANTGICRSSIYRHNQCHAYMSIIFLDSYYTPVWESHLVYAAYFFSQHNEKTGTDGGSLVRVFPQWMKKQIADIWLSWVNKGVWKSVILFICYSYRLLSSPSISFIQSLLDTISWFSFGRPTPLVSQILCFDEIWIHPQFQRWMVWLKCGQSKHSIPLAKEVDSWVGMWPN